jgi:hypothetical protein
MRAYWVPCVARLGRSATLAFLLKFGLLLPEGGVLLVYTLG